MQGIFGLEKVLFDTIKRRNSMWYDITRCIYVNLIEAARTEDWWKSDALEARATDVMEKINDTFNHKKLKTSAFNDLKKKMCAYLSINSIIGEDVGRDAPVVVDKFGEDKLEVFSKKTCVFYYFLINEMGAWKKESEIEVYDTLLENTGISCDLAPYESMEEFITTYIIETDNNFDRWLKLIRNWYDNNDNYQKDLKEPFMDSGESYKNLTLGRLGDLLEQGRDTQNNTRATRMSLEQINLSMDDIQRNNPAAETIEELFDGYANTIGLILDAETRRQWYFLDMIYKTINQQVKDLKGARRNNMRNDFEELKSHLWLEKNTDVKNNTDDENNNRPLQPWQKSWSEITINCTEEDLGKAIDDSFISPARVSKGFQDCLDEARHLDEYLACIEYGFEERNSKERYLAYKAGRNAEEVSDNNNTVKSLVFEKAEVMGGGFSDKNEEEYDKENRINRSGYRTGETNFRKHLRYGRKVTKELLLLTQLVSIANGVKYDANYINDHVLYNSRYSKDLNPRNLFTKFYNTTLERIINEPSLSERKEIMSENATQYIQRYLELTGFEGSLFYDVLMGNEISVNGSAEDE